MTRLISEQIRSIPEALNYYDDELKTKTGFNLKEIAAVAAGIKDEQQLDTKLYKVAVIPVTAGLGTIEGFSEAIWAIAGHLGFSAFITSSSDVSGLVEAYERKADLALLADDNKYVAINLITRHVAENDQATASGYCAALANMAGGLNGKEVLLIGAGPLGRAAARFLAKTGAELIIYDLDKKREILLAETVRTMYGVKAIEGLALGEALKRYPLIFDASPGENIIRAAMINDETMIAAPGIPLGLDSEALAVASDRLIHDPLQIGTAVMLLTALT